MQLLNLPAEPVPPHDIVVELVPPRRGRDFWSRELCERGDVEAVEDEAKGVDGEGEREEEEEGRCVHF